MGGFSLSLFIFMRFLFLLSNLHLILTHSSPSMQPLCHDDESSALLQFKDSFLIDESSSGYSLDDESACQKFASWKLAGEKSDCCSWGGVECDEDTGHVIGLDLSNSCLFGSINSNSSLFRLVYLQKLNLAYNHFNYSHIPSQVGALSRLTHLILSGSKFSGQIPLEISQLSHLSSLELSSFDLSQDSVYPVLELKKPSLESLVRNLSRLKELDLNWVDISSNVPDIFTNLSSLTFLSLANCGLYGEFPIDIFKLSNLQYLFVGTNKDLTGYLPNFTWSSSLETLILMGTSFSGEIPASIGSLGFLTQLNLKDCNFSGSIPSSLGNLSKLTSLDLSSNSFVGSIPFSLGNLSKLTDLYLSSNSFVGPIPSSLGNLAQLNILSVPDNRLTGPIPFRLANFPQLALVDLSYNLLSGEMHFGLMNNTQLTSLRLRCNQLTGTLSTFELTNFTKLVALDLRANKFYGQISNSLFNLKNLQFLDLSDNHLIGIVDFDKFVKLKELIILHISGNQLSLFSEETSANATLHKFRALGFSSCNLSEFPNFLKHQHDQLSFLNLSHNKIHGQVPEWMWNTKNTDPQVLDLRSNFLQGPLPIPPVSTYLFYISSNLLTGNIPESFCNLTSLQILDLANNNLSGSLPRCLDNFGDSLLVLDLQRNKFRGSIPKTWVKGGKLRIVNFSRNKFQGHLPRSLAKCVMLKVLDLSDNQFNDRFPFWLGHLPNLEVVILRSNRFNGPMGTPQSYFKFPNMRILDISNNDFMGKLPSSLLENWNARKFENVHSLTYIIDESSNFTIQIDLGYFTFFHGYTYSMMMTNKGKDMFYEKVQELFIAIDFSSNRFVGEIPKSIGNLKGALLLNFSNNALTGHIPPSLGSLIELEALDLSQNKLSGEIPQQLTQLTFLEFFNVSHNILTGPIPQGKQFDTFENNSFEGNPRLCGRPLTRKCENSNKLPSQPSISQESQDSRSPFEFGWKIVAIGYGFGFVVGVIIGRIVIARKHDWLMKTLRIRPLGGRRCRN